MYKYNGGMHVCLKAAVLVGGAAQAIAAACLHGFPVHVVPVSVVHIRTC